MKLSDLGEFGLIERLKKQFPAINGDDAAVIKTARPPDRQTARLQLVTTDTLIENVHFKLVSSHLASSHLVSSHLASSFFAVGYKAMLANVSDILAMGGYPTYALVTIGVPAKIEIKQVDELYRGINKLAKKNKIQIIGGDTTRSEKVIVSITLLGEVEKENLLLRKGAKVGNMIFVAGHEKARKIAKSHLATAMIDSSDGWARSVIEICKASKVGAKIFKGQASDKMLYGGEDYNLIFTGDERLAKMIPAKIIGEIVKGKKVLGTKSGGYEHFK